jgi:hypothetical protein
VELDEDDDSRLTADLLFGENHTVATAAAIAA